MPPVFALLCTVARFDCIRSEFKKQWHVVVTSVGVYQMHAVECDPANVNPCFITGCTLHCDTTGFLQHANLYSRSTLLAIQQ